MKYFSWFTLFYGLFIVIAASFLQQFLFFLYKIFNESNVKSFFYYFCIFLFIFILYRLTRKGFIIKGFIITVFSLLITILLIYIQTIFAEKIHVIMYGLLGYLSLGDMLKVKIKMKKAIIFAACFCLLISILDEIFQAILPYRVGELYDLIMNFISSLLGFLLYFGLNQKAIQLIP